MAISQKYSRLIVERMDLSGNEFTRVEIEALRTQLKILIQATDKKQIQANYDIVNEMRKNEFRTHHKVNELYNIASMRLGSLLQDL